MIIRRSIILAVLMLTSAVAQPPLNTKGINSSRMSISTLLTNTRLTGKDVAIGQVEPGRPAVPGVHGNANTNIVPTMSMHGVVDVHATDVAGIMISSNLGFEGVAPEASLISSGIINASYNDDILATQYVARQSIPRTVLVQREMECWWLPVNPSVVCCWGTSPPNPLGFFAFVQSA